MPNHVENHIEFSGDTRQIKAMLESIKNDEYGIAQIPVGIILYEMKKGLNKRFFQKKHEKRLIFLSKYSIIRLYL